MIPASGQFETVDATLDVVRGEQAVPVDPHDDLPTAHFERAVEARRLDARFGGRVEAAAMRPLCSSEKRRRYFLIKCNLDQASLSRCRWQLLDIARSSTMASSSGAPGH